MSLASPVSIILAIRPEMHIPSDMTLEELVNHARATVPFYRNVSRIEECPVVSKRLILADLERFVSCDAPRRSELLSFLTTASSDGATEMDWGAGVVVEQTSGSSGVPFRIPKWKADRLATSVAIWRYRKAIDPEASPSRLYAAIHAPQDALRISWAHLVDSLDANGIRWIHANPPILVRLAEIVRNAGNSPRSLKFAESSGQHLADDVRNRLEQALGLRVIDQYGCREVSAIGYALEANRFTLIRDNVHVELIDASGRAISLPGVPGRIVVSSLHNTLMPFLRYDTGDEGHWVDVDGARFLALRPFRNHHMVVGSKGVVGTVLFKDLLIAAYHRVGYPAISHLHIRQTAPAAFIMETDHPECAELLVRMVEKLFNEAGILPNSAIFALRKVESRPDLLPDLDKMDLFTNDGGF